jgi:spore maturation protein CgeB
MKIFRGGDDHTLFRTPELAASADAVLGFGRPGRSGWLDVRVFQYTGAGAVLIHDDVGGFLEPWVHYCPYSSGSVESVSDALDWISLKPEESRKMRQRAFDYVQRNHSAEVRVKEALRSVRLEL